MKKLLFMMALTAIVFTSCDKEDEYTLTHKFSGELNIKLENKNGQAIEGVKLILKDEGDELDEQITDAKGNLTFGSVNSGNYTIYGEDIKDGDYHYDVYKPVQVVAAEEKEATIVPSDFNTTINLQVSEYYQHQSNATALQSDIKVALIQLPDHHIYQYDYDDLTLEDLKEYMLTEQQADGSKKEFVFENVPLHNYLLLFYTDNNNYKVVTNINAYSKDQTVYLKYSIESIHIREYRADQKFYVQQRVHDPNSYYYNYKPYANCQIYILKHTDFRNLNNYDNFEIIKSLAIDEGTTDTEGNATINVIKHRNLVAVCFNPENVSLGYYTFSLGYYTYDNTIDFTEYNYN